MRQVHEGRVSKIHRPIPVLCHQPLDLVEVAIDRKHRYSAGSNERPGSRDIVPIVSDEMKQLGQHRRWWNKGKPKLLERIAATRVLGVVTIEVRDQSARIRERSNVRGQDASSIEANQASNALASSRIVAARAWPPKGLIPGKTRNRLAALPRCLLQPIFVAGERRHV
jgi:hypothetical protein